MNGLKVSISSLMYVVTWENLHFLLGGGDLLWESCENLTKISIFLYILICFCFVYQIVKD